MSLEFLSPIATAGADGPAPLARSPMERQALAAGARLDVRDGWRVAADYGSVEREVETTRTTVGWADSSHLGKLELQAPPEVLTGMVAAVSDGTGLEPGRAARSGGAWWCWVAAERALVISEPAALAELRERLTGQVRDARAPASVVEVTTGYAALTIAGPLAREVIARFCAIDLRPKTTPVGGFRPGSVARTGTPGYVLREDADRFLVLFGWALGEYMWTVVADAAAHLGGAPVGVDALPSLPEPDETVAPVETSTEVRSHA